MMNFGTLKATFSRRSNRRCRSPSDSAPDIIRANGVADNKEESPLHLSHLDDDQKQRSVVLKSTKHKSKADKTGLWKTLRLKLGSNRQCWDANESPSDSDDSDPSFSPANQFCKQTCKLKTNTVCPVSTHIHVAKHEVDNNVSLINGEMESSNDAYCEQCVSPLPINGENNSLRPIKWTISEKQRNNDSTGSLSFSNNASCNISYDFYASVPNNEIRSLTRELFKLSKYGWYWGPITRTEAEEKLSDQPDGAFLVRDSSDDRHLLSLSFRSYGKTLHTRIEHCNGLFSFYANPELEGHNSIVDLIDDSMNYSQSGVFCYSRARSPGSLSFPVRLTKPVSRFTQVRTLQYLCRFVIRQYTRFDHIQKLPLPSKIRGYIEEGHY